MGQLKENTITLLGTAVGVDCNSTGFNGIATAPPGKCIVPDKVVINENSASLAGMDDLNLGGGADGASPAWVDQATGMEAMTTAKDVWTIRNDAALVKLIDGDAATAANRTFGVNIMTATDAAATANFELWGHLIDS